MALHLWPALTLAVQNNWGGPDSADKRDWFAGAIVDLFPDISKLAPSALSAQPQSNDEPDQIDVETVLLQVMLDEFEVNVDDESAFEVAENIMRVRGGCLRGKLDEADDLRRRYEAGKGKKVVGVQGQDEDHETDWDTEDDSDESEENDVEMGDAPAPKEKQEPEVDEDGFTKVTRKKR